MIKGSLENSENVIYERLRNEMRKENEELKEMIRSLR